MQDWDKVLQALMSVSIVCPVQPVNLYDAGSLILFFLRTPIRKPTTQALADALAAIQARPDFAKGWSRKGAALVGKVFCYIATM